jgi:hypothetical protein
VYVLLPQYVVGQLAHVEYVGVPVQVPADAGEHPLQYPLVLVAVQYVVGQEEHVEYVGVPEQYPAPASTPHPGQRQPLPLFRHCAHEEYKGVPEQAGATLKTCGGAPRLVEVGSLQQILPVQSLLCWHAFGHVAEQIPSQQIGVVPLEVQSADVLHAFKQGSVAGFKQRPLALRLGSSASTDVQQISPWLLLHSVSDAHDFGHLLAGVQMPCL